MGQIVSSIINFNPLSSHGNVIRATWSGINGAGAISIPGLRVGDRMLQLLDSGQNLDSGILFYTQVVVSVADELQQNHTGDLTTIAFDGVFVRGL
jgi:hypothetical protein